MSNIEDCAKLAQDSLDILDGKPVTSHISISDAYIILSHLKLLPYIDIDKQKIILLTPRRMIIYGYDNTSLFVGYLRNENINRTDKQQVALFYIYNNLCVKHLWDVIYETCYDNKINECNLAITIEYLTGVYYQKMCITDFSILEHYQNKYTICKILLAILCSRDIYNIYTKKEAADILFTNRYHTFRFANCSYLSDLECRHAYERLVPEQDPTLKIWTL